MLNLPRTTEVNKIIAKDKIYDKADVPNALKQSFIKDIDRIVWANKIAPATMNITAGRIDEIQVFHIRLKNPSIHQKILETIDKAVPYVIVYVLEYEERFQCWIGYKEKSANNTLSVVKYFHDEWADQPSLSIKGTKTDTIYENLLASLSPNIKPDEETSDLKEQVEKSVLIDALEKDIEKLTVKMFKEKQFDKKCRMNVHLLELTRKLEELKDEKTGNENH